MQPRLFHLVRHPGSFSRSVCLTRRETSCPLTGCRRIALRRGSPRHTLHSCRLSAHAIRFGAPKRHDLRVWPKTLLTSLSFEVCSLCFPFFCYHALARAKLAPTRLSGRPEAACATRHLLTSRGIRRPSNDVFRNGISREIPNPSAGGPTGTRDWRPLPPLHHRYSIRRHDTVHHANSAYAPHSLRTDETLLSPPNRSQSQPTTTTHSNSR